MWKVNDLHLYEQYIEVNDQYADCIVTHEG